MFSKKITYTDALQELVPPLVGTAVIDRLHVAYDTAREVLVVNWEGEANSEEIRRGYDILMEQICLYKPQKLLLDFHNRVKIRRSDQRWVFSHVFPQILRTVGDNVFVAIVLPVSLYYGLVCELNGDELMDKNNFLIIHHALYREEAYRWLQDMCPCTVA